MEKDFNSSKGINMLHKVALTFGFGSSLFQTVLK